MLRHVVPFAICPNTLTISGMEKSMARSTKPSAPFRVQFEQALWAVLELGRETSFSSHRSGATLPSSRMVIRIDLGHVKVFRPENRHRQDAFALEAQRIWAGFRPDIDEDLCINPIRDVLCVLPGAVLVVEPELLPASRLSRNSLLERPA